MPTLAVEGNLGDNFNDLLEALQTGVTRSLFSPIIIGSTYLRGASLEGPGLGIET